MPKSKDARLKEILKSLGVMKPLLDYGNISKNLTLPENTLDFPATWLDEAYLFLKEVAEVEFLNANRIFRMQSPEYWITMRDKHHDFDTFEESIALEEPLDVLRKYVRKNRTKLFRKGERNNYVKSRNNRKSSRGQGSKDDPKTTKQETKKKRDAGSVRKGK